MLVDEDATGVAALARRGDTWLVYVNGKEHSWIPFGGAHSTLGAGPALVHPEPRSVAVIGLGSGDTVWAAGCRSETTSLVVFEIAAPQPRLLRRLAAASELPQLAQLLSDPRLRISIEDGRNAIARSTETFDVIEADALWPHVGYSGNLYSVEFFERCAAKLRPGRRDVHLGADAARPADVPARLPARAGDTRPLGADRQPGPAAASRLPNGGAGSTRLPSAPTSDAASARRQRSCWHACSRFRTPSGRPARRTWTATSFPGTSS